MISVVDTEATLFEMHACRAALLNVFQNVYISNFTITECPFNATSNNQRPGFSVSTWRWKQNERKKWNNERYETSLLFLITSLKSTREYLSFPFSIPMEGFSWDDLRKIVRGRQRMVKLPNGVETLPKISTDWLGRMNVTDDRQTIDGRGQRIANVHEFTFATNH